MAAGNHSLTKGGKIKTTPIEKVCEWIIRAWGLITPEIVERSFKKTGISCALDGSEDDAIRETIDPANVNSEGSSDSNCGD